MAVIRLRQLKRWVVLVVLGGAGGAGARIPACLPGPTSSSTTTIWLSGGWVELLHPNCPVRPD